MRVRWTVPAAEEFGTRELALSPLPYIIAYRIQRDAVEILKIWHTAQDRR